MNVSQKPPALEGTNFLLWSSFLGGQLSYKLTLNESGGQGKINKLMFLLDYNEDRSLQVPSYKRNAIDSSNNLLNFDTAFRSIRGLSAKIPIDTLSPYISFGGGIYTMTVVKRMTATDDFLKMQLKDRRTFAPNVPYLIFFDIFYRTKVRS